MIFNIFIYTHSTIELTLHVIFLFYNLQDLKSTIRERKNSLLLPSSRLTFVLLTKKIIAHWQQKQAEDLLYFQFFA